MVSPSRDDFRRPYKGLGKRKIGLLELPNDIFNSSLSNFSLVLFSTEEKALVGCVQESTVPLRRLIVSYWREMHP